MGLSEFDLSYIPRWAIKRFKLSGKYDFYLSRDKIAEWNYLNGEKHGDQFLWDLNGDMSREIYEHGIRISLHDILYPESSMV